VASATKLKFFADNPRVYSVMWANGKQPTQEEIQQQLRELEHVKELGKTLSGTADCWSR
jgi:hypothetical protein